MTEYILITKREAKAQGLNKYFTGKPCKNGHISPRRTYNHACVACSIANSTRYNNSRKDEISTYMGRYNKQYYKANKEESAESSRQYYINNKEQLCNYQKQHRIENLDQCRAAGKRYRDNNLEICLTREKTYRDTHSADVLIKHKKWRILNPDKVAMHTGKRRANKLQATPSWYEYHQISLLYSKAQEWSGILGCSLHVDHIIPLQSKTVCGLHCFANMQLLDKSINGAKGNNYQTDW